MFDMEEKDIFVKEQMSWTSKTIYYLDKVATWAIPFVVMGVLMLIGCLYALYMGIIEKEYVSVVRTMGASLVVGFSTYFLILFIIEAKTGITQMDEVKIYSALGRLKYVFVLTIIMLLMNMISFVSMFV